MSEVKNRTNQQKKANRKKRDKETETSSDKTRELKIMVTRERKASEENPKKTNTDFLWTNDKIQLLLPTSFNFKSKWEFE